MQILKNTARNIKSCLQLLFESNTANIHRGVNHCEPIKAKKKLQDLQQMIPQKWL